GGAAAAASFPAARQGAAAPVAARGAAGPPHRPRAFFYQRWLCGHHWAAA
nr:hypothetical protein [Tanacetum cinerariifolium]